MSSTEVQNPRFKPDDKLVVFNHRVVTMVADDSSSYKRFALVWMSNCIRQSMQDVAAQFIIHINHCFTLRTIVREPPACIRSMKGSYCNFVLRVVSVLWL